MQYANEKVESQRAAVEMDTAIKMKWTKAGCREL